MSTLLVAFALLDAILLVGVLLIYLNWVAGLLEKIDNGLATTVDLVVQIVGHAEPIIPGLQQINRTLGIISGRCWPSPSRMTSTPKSLLRA